MTASHDKCFKDGNYDGNLIVEIRGNKGWSAWPKDNPNAEKCQKYCQSHARCKFWTYDSSNRKCYRHTEAAQSALGTCKSCKRGPRFCSGN